MIRGKRMRRGGHIIKFHEEFGGTHNVRDDRLVEGKQTFKVRDY